MNQAPQVIIYIMCFIASMVCAVMLLRGFRRTGTRLLLWSGLCFSFLCLNNLAVLFDILVFPALDLQAWRHAAALAAVSVLLIGLVWESE
jgi:cytochrome bd-type quinol oxidase subunit 2